MSVFELLVSKLFFVCTCMCVDREVEDFVNCFHYCIALIFCESLIFQISQVWNRLRNYFIKKFDNSKLSHIEQRIHKIISTKLKKTPAIHENLDPRNISTIRYTVDCKILVLIFCSNFFQRKSHDMEIF